MIVAGVPYCPEDEGTDPEPGMDLGYAMNKFMGMLGEDDWGFLIDHDLLFTTRVWYRQLEAVIRDKPDAGFFTVLRFPTAVDWYKPKIKKDRSYTEDKVRRVFDLRWHRHIGKMLADKKFSEIQDVTEWERLKGGSKGAGIFLISKRVWHEVGGFKNGFKTEKIDQDMYSRVRDAGRRIYLMKGFYMFHLKDL